MRVHFVGQLPVEPELVLGEARIHVLPRVVVVRFYTGGRQSGIPKPAHDPLRMRINGDDEVRYETVAETVRHRRLRGNEHALIIRIPKPFADVLPVQRRTSRHDQRGGPLSQRRFAEPQNALPSGNPGGVRLGVPESRLADFVKRYLPESGGDPAAEATRVVLTANLFFLVTGVAFARPQKFLPRHKRDASAQAFQGRFFELLFQRGCMVRDLHWRPRLEVTFENAHRSFSISAGLRGRARVNFITR